MSEKPGSQLETLPVADDRLKQKTRYVKAQHQPVSISSNATELRNSNRLAIVTGRNQNRDSRRDDGFFDDAVDRERVRNNITVGSLNLVRGIIITMASGGSDQILFTNQKYLDNTQDADPSLRSVRDVNRIVTADMLKNIHTFRREGTGDEMRPDIDEVSGDFHIERTLGEAYKYIEGSQYIWNHPDNKVFHIGTLREETYINQRALDRITQERSQNNSSPTDENHHSANTPETSDNQSNAPPEEEIDFSFGLDEEQDILNLTISETTEEGETEETLPFTRTVVGNLYQSHRGDMIQHSEGVHKSRHHGDLMRVHQGATTSRQGGGDVIEVVDGAGVISKTIRNNQHLIADIESENITANINAGNLSKTLRANLISRDVVANHITSRIDGDEDVEYFGTRTRTINGNYTNSVSGLHTNISVDEVKTVNGTSSSSFHGDVDRIYFDNLRAFYNNRISFVKEYDGRFIAGPRFGVSAGGKFELGSVKAEAWAASIDRKDVGVMLIANVMNFVAGGKKADGSKRKFQRTRVARMFRGKSWKSSSKLYPPKK